MQTKTLSERIEELQIADLYDDEATIDDAIEIIRDLQAELKNENDFKNCFRYHNERLILENEALLAKNKELEEELQERKAYIVANPCAQCGGRINAMKCDAWAKKAKELEEKLKNNLEETEECCPIETAEAAWNMSEVSEVERALEEVKDQLKWNDYYLCPKRLDREEIEQIRFKRLNDLNKKAQNLVNALEAEKKPFFKVREEGQFEGSPPTKETFARHEETIKRMKEGLKEECVEPVSIWKDVSELPYYGCRILVKHKHHIQIIPYYYCNGIFTPDNKDFSLEIDNSVIKKFCLLTDFVNQAEDMEARLRKLEDRR